MDTSVLMLLGGVVGLLVAMLICDELARRMEHERWRLLMNTMADVLNGIAGLQAQVAALPPGQAQLATQDQIDAAVTGIAAVGAALTGASGPPAAPAA